MKTIYVRWRHVPLEAKFTPLMYLSVEHTQVEAHDDSDWNVRIAITKNFDWVNPDDIVIESKQVINHKP